MLKKLLIYLPFIVMDTNGDNFLAKRVDEYPLQSCSISEKIIRQESKTQFFEFNQDFYHNQFFSVDEISKQILEGAQAPFYRWNNLQRNFYVIDHQNQMKVFYAKGYKNILNKSQEAEKLTQKINNMCDETKSNFTLLGKFQIDLIIGTKIFNDILIVNENAGQYIVPNSFESKIKSLKFENGLFHFIIRVQEGEDDYEAYFEGEIDSSKSIKGKAYILPNKDLLGEFTGFELKE